MTYIAINFNDVNEPSAAPEGSYELQITSCEVVEQGPNSKNPGKPMYKVSLGFPTLPSTPNISHYITFPAESDSASTAEFKALNLKRFFSLFGVPHVDDGFDLEETAMAMIGATGEAFVTRREPNENGVVYNEVKLPRLNSNA